MQIELHMQHNFSIRTLSAYDLRHVLRAGHGDALGDVLRLLGRAREQGRITEVAEGGILAGRGVRSVVQIEHG